MYSLLSPFLSIGTISSVYQSFGALLDHMGHYMLSDAFIVSPPTEMSDYAFVLDFASGANKNKFITTAK